MRYVWRTVWPGSSSSGFETARNVTSREERSGTPGRSAPGSRVGRTYSHTSRFAAPSTVSSMARALAKYCDPTAAYLNWSAPAGTCWPPCWVLTVAESAKVRRDRAPRR